MPTPPEQPNKKNEPWEEAELRAAVLAYVEMQRKQALGGTNVKSEIYAELAAKFGRTTKAYEYRMQNISAVFDAMGRPWVAGLKPAKNMGYRVGALIERLISEVEGDQTRRAQFLAEQVRAEYIVDALPKPDGVKQPKHIFSLTKQIERDPKVKAWVLRAADGRCECCGQLVPFTDDNGMAFLEVHHLRQLADGGSDRVENAVAICPNCHRELHFGSQRSHLYKKLYDSIARLEFE